MKNFSTCVIIPNYNEIEHLGVCLESVISQSEPFDEIIFIDDASTDDSLALGEKMLQELTNVRILRNKVNLGTERSINRALELCTSDYVMFLSANDIISIHLVNRFKNSVTCEVGFWTALSVNLSTDGSQIMPRRTPIVSRSSRYFNAEETIKLGLAYVNWNTGTSTLYNAALVRAHRGLSPIVGGLSDWLLCLIVGIQKGSHFHPEILCKIRSHSNAHLSRTMTDEHLIYKASAYLEQELSGRYCSAEQLGQLIERVKQRILINQILSALKDVSGNHFNYRLPMFLKLLGVLFSGSGMTNLLISGYGKYIRYRSFYADFLRLNF